MQQLIHCSKCHSIPYDVLMMNCNHNLCVKCASERLQTQSSNKSAIGKFYLQCQKCKTRTNLDQESVAQLQKVKKNKSYVQKVYYEKDEQKRVQTPINTNRSKNMSKKQQKQVQKPQIKAQPQTKLIQNTKKGINEQSKQKQQKTKPKVQTPQKSKAIINSSKVELGKEEDAKIQKPAASDQNYGSCQVHKQEPVMYYCFQCKLHCFCAECVLVGKHNQHDVKIIKKAYAIVQKDFLNAIVSTKNYISQLQQINKAAANDINASKNRIDAIKKSIEKGFDQVRAIIREKQVTFMKMVDEHYMKMMETNNGAIKKTVQSKLKQQLDLLSKMQGSLKKGQKTVLNLYADEWPKISQLLKHQTIKLPIADSSFSQSLTQYTVAIKKQIQKIQPKSVSG